MRVGKISVITLHTKKGFIKFLIKLWKITVAIDSSDLSHYSYYHFWLKFVQGNEPLKGFLNLSAQIFNEKEDCLCFKSTLTTFYLKKL